MYFAINTKERIMPKTMPEEDVLPTGQDIREAYLQPLANVPEIRLFISFNTTVVGISKKITIK